MSYKKITKDINSAAPNQHLPAVSAARKAGCSLEVLTSTIHHSANTFAPVLLWSVPLLFSAGIDITRMEQMRVGWGLVSMVVRFRILVLNRWSSWLDLLETC